MRHSKTLDSSRALWKLFGVAYLILLVQVSGCTTTATENDDTSNTFVNVNAVTATPGGLTQGDEGSALLSDVCFTDLEHPPCSVFNDNATVTFQARPKDLTNTFSATNDLFFSRYRVTYTRADGRNVPGVDVPFAFDGVSSFRVPVDGTEVLRSVIVVRHQAKIESPLRELSQALGGIVSVLAQLDFYGQDGAGRQVQVRAYLSITFADFANE